MMTRNVVRFAWVAVLGLAARGGVEARAGLVLTAEAAGVQSTSVTGVTTERFDEFSPGLYRSLITAVGTVSSPNAAIVAANQYGGAGGAGHFISVGSQSQTLTMTLTLPAPEAFFGFWWSAADAGNSISFYSSGGLLATFNPVTALGALGPAYFGNPNGGDSGEKFAYLNLFGNGGTRIDKVVFNNATLSSGFESDNWSIRATEVTPPYPGTPIGGITVTTPEPSTVAAAVLGGLLGLASLRRRRAA